MSHALKEWHVVCEAIARGDQVLTVRKGGIHEKAFAVPRSAFWLFPTWEHENAAETKPAWHGELALSRREKPAGDRIPLRCHCTVADSWELHDAAALDAIDELHLWTRAYVQQRLDWRPTKPLTVLLLRAEALVDPFQLATAHAYTGCRSWLELAEEPPAEGLIAALGEQAFALRAAIVRDALGPGSVT